MYRRALLIALVCGVAAVSLFLLYLKRYEMEASGGERVRVLVALRALDRGAALTDEGLGVREIPQAYVESRSVRAVDRAKVLGLRLSGALQSQETLMWTDLAVAGEERRDLSSLVQPGRRAMTIRVRDESGGALVRPGDYVDVIAVMPQGNGSGQPAAAVLLQHTLVLAVGAVMSPDADAKGFDNRGQLTLSVALPDAQLLAVAGEKGELAVALRGSDDNQTAQRLPDVTLSSLSALERSSDRAAERHAPTELKPTAALP